MTSTPKQVFSYANKYLILHWLIRNTLDFTNAEFKVLLFTWDRTIVYNHWTEAIPYSHFMQGVHRSFDGALHSPGTGMGEGSLKKAIRGLVTRGILVRVKNVNARGTIYRINTRWVRPHPTEAATWEFFHPDELYPVAQDGNRPNDPRRQDDNRPTKYRDTEEERLPEGNSRLLARREGLRRSYPKQANFVVRPLPKTVIRSLAKKSSAPCRPKLRLKFKPKL